MATVWRSGRDFALCWLCAHARGVWRVVWEGRCGVSRRVRRVRSRRTTVPRHVHGPVHCKVPDGPLTEVSAYRRLICRVPGAICAEWDDFVMVGTIQRVSATDGVQTARNLGQTVPEIDAHQGIDGKSMNKYAKRSIGRGEWLATPPVDKDSAVRKCSFGGPQSASATTHGGSGIP